MRVSDFSIWMRGGYLFCGSWEIKVVVRAQGGFLGTDLHELFVCDVRVLQGAGDYNGGESDKGGIIKGL